MSFKFFASLDFTGEPTVTQFRFVYGMGVMKVCPSPISDYSTLTINDDLINYYVDLAISQGWEAIAWNEDNLRFYIWNEAMSEADKDSALDCLVEIYNRSKDRATAGGRPDLKIGWYDIPGGYPDLYNVILSYNKDSEDSVNVKAYQKWLNWITRLSQRYEGGLFVSSPFNDCCDFVAPNLQPFYGNDQTYIDDWKIFATTVLGNMIDVSKDDPLYAFCSFTFSPTTVYAGVQVSGTNMSQMVETIRGYADGFIINGGLAANRTYSNWFWRPSGATEANDLSLWKTVSSGAFSMTVANVKLKIQGVNTSSAVSMTQVASILQTAIQSKISSGPNPSFDGVYPYPLGTVTVTWSSAQKGFLFNMTTNGASTPMPANLSRSLFTIESKSVWGSTVSGVDLASDQFLGVATVNGNDKPGTEQWVYGGTEISNEWELYARDEDWWGVLSESSSEIIESDEFKYFISCSITEQPTPTSFEDDYGISFMQTGGCTPWTESIGQAATTLLTSTLTLSNANIDAAISSYLSPSLGVNQKKFFAFDLEGYGIYLDPTQYSDTVVDNMLDSFINAFVRMKERLALQGIYDVKIGIYANPCFKSYYAPALYFYGKGNTSQYNTDYNTWVSKFRRMNLRKSGDTYITKAFNDYLDFVTCDIYPIFGEEDPLDDSFFKENLTQAVRYISGDKPLYPFLNPAFHPSSPWSSKPVSGDYMKKMMTWVKRIADGAILWITSSPSYRSQRQRHFMTSSGGPPAVPTKTLADWQGITNGCFSYFVIGYYRDIENVDFSVATSIGGAESTSVVNIIEAAINADLYYINNFISQSVTYPSLSISRPYEVGSVFVEYNSNSSNNSPTALSQVPCFEFSYIDPAIVSPPDQSSYTGREFIYCYSYSDTLPGGGTNIGTVDWIGTYTYTYQEYDSNVYSGQDADPDEWNNGWVVDNDWWHAFSSMAVANKYSQERTLTFADNMGVYTGSSVTGMVSSWSGKPAPYVLKNSDYVDRVHLVYTSSTAGWSQFTDSLITTNLQNCINQKATYFVWDIEGDYCNVISSNNNGYQYGVSEATVDYNLDQFKSIYNRTKAIAASLGHPEIQVGFYGSPFTANTFYGARYWADPASYAGWETASLQFRDGLIRINQRLSSGTTYDDPFLDYNDFLAPSFYPQSGNTKHASSEKGERDAIQGFMMKAIEILGHSKRYLPFFMPTFFEQGGLNPLTGWAQKNYNMQMLCSIAVEYGCDGGIMWSGSWPSNVASDQTFTPTVVKTLANWQAITDGCFIIAVEGFPVKVTGLNFSAATSIGGAESTSVANIIEAGMNAKIATITITDEPWASPYATPPKSPRHIGDVTVAWDGTKFVMNSDKGLLKSPPGWVSPPDFEKSYWVTAAWSTWGAGALPGTDIGVPQWIGNHNVWTSLTFTRTDLVDEFGRWVEDSGWWASYSSFALGSLGNNITNRVVPTINLVTSSSGDVPFTVHVDASNSLFNGVNPQDCIFEWDFGDNFPTSDSKARGYVSDPRNDNDVNAIGTPHKKTSLSAKQRGINASYTYWHDNSGTPFLISLKIWYNGVVSDTVYYSVTASDPVTVAYPTNDLTKWVTLTVAPNDSVLPPVDSFATINAAMAWIDANRPDGEVIIELLTEYTATCSNFLLTSKLTINKPNIIIYGSRTYTESNAIIAADNSSFNRASPTPLVEIGAAAYNVHFYDVQFGASEDISGDGLAGQGSDNTSNLIGCSVLSPSSASDIIKNVVFTNCQFRNLYQATNSSHFVSGIYFNQCQTSTTKIKSHDLMGYNIVMNGCLFGTLSGIADDALSFAVRTPTDSPINFGSTLGSSEKFSMNFCNVCHNAYLHGDSITSSGPFKITNARFVSIYGNYLYDGSSVVDDSFSVRIHANEIYAGGTKSSLVITAPSSDITIANNVLFPRSYTTANTRCNSGILEFDGSYGLVNNIKIINNTAIAKFNTNYAKAFWNLSRPNNVDISDLEFVNNLAVEEPTQCISSWVMVDSDVSAYIVRFENNLWPQRIGQMNFAIVTGQDITWSDWDAAAYETNSSQIDILSHDLNFIYKYKLWSSTYPNIATSSVLHSAVSKDYNDNTRDTYSSGVGATKPDFAPVYQIPTLSVTSSITTRTRTVDGLWTPPAGSQTGFVTLVDSSETTVNGSYTSVPKPIISSINGAVGFINMDPTTLDSYTSRAFRVKYSPDYQEQQGYTDNVKSIYFGIIKDTSDSNFIKMMCRIVKTDDSVHVLKEKLSNHLTITSLFNELTNFQDGIGVVGVQFDLMGCGYLSPSKIEMLDADNDTDLVITSSKFDILNSWLVYNFDSTQIDIGNFIKTTVSVDAQSDGYDVTITYLNDGPVPDNTDNLPGDVRQRLGGISIDGILAGVRSCYVDQQEGSTLVEYDTWFKNYAGSTLSYPFDRFSPTTILVGESYCVGISVLEDFANTNLNVNEIVSQSSGKTIVTNVLSGRADGEQYWNSSPHLLGSLAYGESYSITISVRITRNIRNWMVSVSPYKDYFTDNFGGVQFQKDPRPFAPIVPAVASNGQPLYYSSDEDASNQNPAKWGWAWWSNKIKNNYKLSGYDRQLMWSSSGLYFNDNSHNYPSIVLTPFLDDTGTYPQSISTTQSDSCYTLSGENCVAGEFVVNSQLLKDTFYMLIDAIQEVPVFGFYQGYGSLVHRDWNPENRDIEPVENMQDQTVVTDFMDQIHLMAYYGKTNWLGIDSYSSGVSGMQNAVRLFDFINSKYNGLRIIAEKTPEDILCRDTISFVSSKDIKGPHLLADYLVPGHEHAAVVYFDNMWEDFPTTEYGSSHILNVMAALARQGYVVGSMEPVNIKTSGISTETFNAVDRRYIYASKPSSVTQLLAPKNVHHSIIDAKSNINYPSINEQKITLWWDENTEGDFSHYILYKAPIINGQIDPNGQYQIKAYLKNPFFVDNQVYPGETYYYRIASVDVYDNVSSQTSYQVTNIADSQILNPPATVSATANLTEYNIEVAWEPPSSEFQPLSSLKSPPKVFIQGGMDSVGALSSPLFDLPFVYLYVNGVISWYDGDSRTMAQRATDAFNRVVSIRNMWLATTGRGRTAENFRWAFWPQGFGYGWGDVSTRPFFYESDRLSNGKYSLFLENCIADTRPRMQEFFNTFASLCSAAGIPDPVYVDPSYQNGMSIAGGLTGDTYSEHAQWHSWIMSDPRSTSVLFNGVESYASYAARATDIYGNSIPANELYANPSSLDTTSAARTCAYVVPKMAAADYGLWKMIYEPAKDVWPSVLTGNFSYHGATTTYMGGGYRFKESAVGFGSNMFADVQVPVNFGSYLYDEYSLATNLLTDSYLTNIAILNLDIDKIKDQSELFKAMRIAQSSYDIQGCFASNPNKEVALWLQYNDYNPSIYNNIYDRSGDRYPDGYGFKAVGLDDRETSMNMYRMLIRTDCNMVGYYCGQTMQVSDRKALHTYDTLYEILSNLGEAGYVM